MSSFDKLFKEDIGKTPDEVAAYLRGAEVRGARMNPKTCPIKILLYKKKMIDWSDGVCAGFVIFSDPQTLNYCLPKHVNEFVVKFDQGGYPDLVGQTEL